MGFDTADVIQSNYLKAHNLANKDGTYRSFVGTIADARTGKYRDGRASIEVQFRENPKWLGLNATNRKMVEKISGGTNSDSWLGKQVEVYVKPDVEFEGNSMPGIRLRPVGSAPAQPAAPAARVPATIATKANLARDFARWAGIDTKAPEFVPQLTKFANVEGVTMAHMLEDEATKLISKIAENTNKGFTLASILETASDLPF